MSEKHKIVFHSEVTEEEYMKLQGIKRVTQDHQLHEELQLMKKEFGLRKFNEPKPSWKLLQYWRFNDGSTMGYFKDMEGRIHVTGKGHGHPVIGGDMTEHELRYRIISLVLALGIKPYLITKRGGIRVHIPL